MKRVGIVSDTHGDRGHLQQALLKLEAEGRLDALIHCGDGARDIRFLDGNILQTAVVGGNCDGMAAELPRELLIDIGGVRIYIAHGHYYNVKRGLDLLAEAASAKGAQVACFGHTHKPVCEYRAGVLLVNPGACIYTGACALLTIEQSGDFAARLL